MGSQRPWVAVYALDVARVAGFYAAVLGLEADERSDGYVVLASDDVEVAVVRIMDPYADGIVVADPPERREDSAVKASFVVPDLAAARRTAAEHGGVVDGTEREWEFRGHRAVDGHDPEGNVLQLREPLA
jgi:predicted enzyme related to lactoylglutathione lyase